MHKQLRMVVAMNSAHNFQALLRTGCTRQPSHMSVSVARPIACLTLLHIDISAAACFSALRRLAMMAIIGMFFQDGLTGSAWGDWALYTA